MDRDAYADMFRFALGECVRWAEHPHTRLYIFQRRWTQREIFDPVVHYRVRTSKTGKDPLSNYGYDWTDERDLMTWDDAVQ